MFSLAAASRDRRLEIFRRKRPRSDAILFFGNSCRYSSEKKFPTPRQSDGPHFVMALLSSASAFSQRLHAFNRVCTLFP